MLKNEKHKLVIEKEILNDQLNASQKQIKSLEQSQQVLKNEKADLTDKNQKLTAERDELIVSHQDKSDLDLHNRRLASANQDLKRQNRKLEEENIALKERGLKEQPSKQPKP
ncbi:hypothetical protein HpBGD97_03380 [Helicobacter pylori]